MKRISAVAVALLLAVSSSFAAWDYFPVIEQGSVEANINNSGNIKIRYGVAENWEIFSTNNSYNCGNIATNYFLGARYQIIPEMLGLHLDMGIPTGRWGDFGLTPGVTFSYGLTSQLDLGAGASLGIDFNRRADGWPNDSSEVVMNLKFGFELDYSLSENVLLWAGADFVMDDMGENVTSKSELSINPMFGAIFSAGNLSIGTMIGLDLDGRNRKGEEATTLWGGVDFSIKF